MDTRAVFPQARRRTGMYESFYLRAFSPAEPVGIWLRSTVRKAPGGRPKGSVWCTVFDARKGRPFMHKVTSDRLSAPAGAWIAVGEDGGDGAILGPGLAQGRCGDARWSLAFRSGEPELRHLPRSWMYRTPLPRTKATSPFPSALFDGHLELADRQTELASWPGMVGHNWGSEHAERWIWLNGVAFADAPDAWLDVVLGRVLIGGRLTPWIASGAIALGGRRHRLGGLTGRGLRVSESPAGCSVTLGGPQRIAVDVRARVPADAAAGWRYSDPGGGEHDVINCSVCELEVEGQLPGDGGHQTLSTTHGGAYELGMRERDHGVPIAPFADA